MDVLELNFMFSVQSLTKKVQDQFHNTTFTFTKSNTTRQHNLHRKFKTKFTVKHIIAAAKSANVSISSVNNSIFTVHSGN